MDYQIKVLRSTPLATNNYLLTFGDEAILVEASATVEQLKSALEGRKLCAIFLTHSHFDHAINLEKLLKTFDTKCYMHKNCLEKIRNHQKMFYGDRPFCVQGCDDRIVFVNDHEKLVLCNQEITCLYTPGHPDDSMCYIIGENVFVGDLLFSAGYGRTDLPSGNEESLKLSIPKILDLGKNLAIMPGHFEATSIQEQQKLWRDLNG